MTRSKHWISSLFQFFKSNLWSTKCKGKRTYFKGGLPLKIGRNLWGGRHYYHNTLRFILKEKFKLQQHTRQNEYVPQNQDRVNAQCQCTLNLINIVLCCCRRQSFCIRARESCSLLGVFKRRKTLHQLCLLDSWQTSSTVVVVLMIDRWQLIKPEVGHVLWGAFIRLQCQHSPSSKGWY